MDLKDFQTWAITKKASDLTDREAKLTWALGLVDEAVEVEELFSRKTQDHTAILYELGDVAWYAVIVADAYQVNAEGLVSNPPPPFPFWVDTNSKALIFAAKEVGELVKKNVSHGHVISVSELALQLSIVLSATFRLAENFGYNKSSLLDMNRDKLDGRYPGGFSPKASMCRKEARRCDGC